MVHISDGRLRAVVAEIFEAAGAPGAAAQQVAESLVLASLVGHDTHGVRAIAGYIEALENGSVDPHGEIAVVRESATTALLDGGSNFGIIVMHKALDMAMSKARAMTWAWWPSATPATRAGWGSTSCGRQRTVSWAWSSARARCQGAP